MYRICMIAPVPFFEDRGTPIRIYEEAKGLSRLGHQVSVICYHLGREMTPIEIHRMVKIPWYNRINAGATYHKVYLDALLLLKVNEIVSRQQFDIIHAHLHEGAVIAKIRNSISKTKKPIILDAQGSLTGEMSAQGFIDRSSLTFKLWKLLERKIYEMSAVVLVSSHHLSDILKKEFHIPEDKIKVIPDCVDTDLFDPQKFDGEEVRKKYGLAANEIVIYTGLLNKLQGTNFLIEEVIPYVCKERPSTRFLIIGFPKQEYVGMARKIGVEENVLFLGKKPYTEIPKYLAAANIAVTPKYMESGEANLKIATYMAMGLPVVSFDNVHNKKMIQDSGLTTRTGDVEGFAEAIIELLENPKRRKIMGRKARLIAQNEFSWLPITRKIISVYTSMTNN